MDLVRYAKSHEWIAADGTVGVSDHAQHEITDVVFVELPTVGRSVKAGEACAVVESVKAAFDIYAPVDGVVSAVNEAVVKNPALINRSPLSEGWLFRLTVASSEARQHLMAEKDYLTFIQQAH